MAASTRNACAGADPETGAVAAGPAASPAPKNPDREAPDLCGGRWISATGEPAPRECAAGPRGRPPLHLRARTGPEVIVLAPTTDGA